MREALHSSWRDGTHFANHCLTRLLGADTEPLIEQGAKTTLPPIPDKTALLNAIYHEDRNRWPKLDSLGTKHRRWQHDYCHTVAKMIAGLALRYRAKAITLDLTEKSWMPSFPYFMLQTLVAKKGDRIRHNPGSGTGFR